MKEELWMRFGFEFVRKILIKMIGTKKATTKKRIDGGDCDSVKKKRICLKSN